MKFHSKPIREHSEVPLADDGQWEAQLAHFAGRSRAKTRDPQLADDGHNHCYVACVGDWRSPLESRAQLAEILGLVEAQGDALVGHELCRRERPDPRTYVGIGTAEALGQRAREAGADMLVIDAELSPSQTRNLEDAANLPICDREAVILNVFSRHAKTRKARIQVEIAHLEYLRPRIRGIGLNMDQQVGGLTRARGPGETASELLARQLDGRLAELRRQWTRLERSELSQREARSECERIALVGYTNAGKTSLMNALTRARLSARDRPFETLDTTTRSLTRHGGDVVISDTVGFIRRLPERLMASFETTLAEISEASLLAIVIDLSDPEWDMHVDTTEAMLERLDADAIARIYVFNKLDRVDPGAAPSELELRGRCGAHPFVVLSSSDAEAVARLGEALIDAARRDHRRAQILFPYAASELITAAYASCRVLAAEARETGLELSVEGRAHIVARLERGVRGLSS